MRTMMKIALLLGALSIPAFADPPVNGDVGASAGSGAAEVHGSATVDTHSTTHTVKKAGHSATHTAKKAVDATGDAVEDGADAVGDAAGDAAHTAAKTKVHAGVHGKAKNGEAGVKTHVG